MSKFDPKAYSAILRTTEAYRFDAGTFLMRLFAYTTTIGTISTLTLAGVSALEASSVASLIAVCMFFVAPRVSKRIDERGQSAVVPPATAIAAVGLFLMLATTHFGGPFWLNFFAAPLISFLPNAPSLARTRWTFLISSGRLGKDAPRLSTAYAYEGVLEDIAFMIGPAAVVALSAVIAPIAGMLIGFIVYCIGTALLISSKNTEPEPSLAKHQDGDAPRKTPRKASVLRSSAVVRVLFAVMILFGAVYGALDTAIISYSETVEFAALASIVFAAESVFSVVVSFLFGTLGFSTPLRRQFVIFAIAYGILYSLFVLVHSPTSLIVIACVAALAYSPLYITTNLTCERAVEPENLTEAISWLASGQSIGMVIGPVTAGAVIDAFGSLSGFGTVVGFAICIIVLTCACIPVLRKRL